MRAGKAGRQFDLAQGGRAEVPRPGAGVPRSRCGGDRDGVRRTGAGRLGRPQGRVCARAYELLVDSSTSRREDIIFDPNIFAVATGIAEHDRYGLDFIEATAALRRALPGRSVSGGVSNCRSRSVATTGPRGDALGVPLPRDRQRHAFGHRQRRSAGGVRTDRPELRELCEDVVLARRSDAAERLLGAATGYTGDGSSAQERAGWSGATGTSRSGSSTRSSTASPNSSRPTSRRRACGCGHRCR